MRKLLCKLGFHKYNELEIHCGELPDKAGFKGAALLRCQCQAYKFITPMMQTRVFVSTKHIPTDKCKK